MVLWSLVLMPRIGSSGIGELIANTLAVRNVTTVVLDVNPIVTENCKIESNNHFDWSDNFTR